MGLGLPRVNPGPLTLVWCELYDIKNVKKRLIHRLWNLVLVRVLHRSPLNKEKKTKTGSEIGLYTILLLSMLYVE